ncbi:uncharacterized protein N7498_003733 [Penicillium cinerascens]|uniref:FAD-binding domain-containing protein n=1 Tax=Penicillium cinerascens TaxID=70096 RepID=A0A9W9T755_9EURO|nr:uncharacterized protein N7498_003733 [Penicillium cinerascens]KAJ5212087.1 hypothetical protein N7498_003733 [Penicillium cinerascens]
MAPFKHRVQLGSQPEVGELVEVAGGSVFHGDIVVGADGIHSKVRQEMQRITSEDTSWNDLFCDDEDEVSIAIGSTDRRVGLAFWPAFSSYRLDLRIYSV